MEYTTPLINNGLGWKGKHCRTVRVVTYYLGQPDSWRTKYNSDPLCNPPIKDFVYPLQLNDLLVVETKLCDKYETLRPSNNIRKRFYCGALHEYLRILTNFFK